jgi:hypothetical protein
VALVPLARNLRKAVPECMQPWYADDGGLAGRLKDILRAFKLLMEQGPARGYYPEPSKSILVVKEDWSDEDKEAIAEFKFDVKRGSRYLGSFIGSEETLEAWIQPQIEIWVEAIKTMGEIARRFPQTAYAGMTFSLQQEWQYLHRGTPGVAKYFAPLEKAISESFLPALLEDSTSAIAKLRDQLALSVKCGGIGIPNPVKSAPASYKASVETTSVLSKSLREGVALDMPAYKISSSGTRGGLAKERIKAQKAELERLKKKSSKDAVRKMDIATETGQWLTTAPNTRNNTCLTDAEFKDSIRLRFDLTPANLPQRCEGCGQPFSVEHALTCKKGGLIVQRHDNLKFVWHKLSSIALSQSAVSDEPFIHTVRDVQKAGETGSDPASDLRGDVSVRGFWGKGVTTIFDLQVINTDAPSNRRLSPLKCLERGEKAKKKKYNAKCLDQHRTFVPLVFSVDGLRGPEAAAATKQLASHLSIKWKRPFSETCGYVRSQLSLSLARSVSRSLRADRNPIREPSTPWDSGEGLGLYR